MKHFEELELLGDGAFGVVTKCRDKDSDTEVAVKKLKAKYSSFEDCLNEKEVKSLRKIKHQNVVRLLQVFREQERLFLVFELLGDSLLKTLQQRKKPFDDDEVRDIIGQVLEGLAVIHKQGFFHRDLKPENLLWGPNNVLKIADFGLAREIRSRPPYTEYVSTRWYRAPEVILRHLFYNSPVDLWAVGCIMAELYTLNPIFQGTSEADQLFKICSVLGPPSSKNWPDGVVLAQKMNLKLPTNPPRDLKTLIPNASADAIDLMQRLFSYNPLNRPSALQALSHAFFKGGIKCDLAENLPTHNYQSPISPQKKSQISLEVHERVDECSLYQPNSISLTPKKSPVGACGSRSASLISSPCALLRAGESDDFLPSVMDTAFPAPLNDDLFSGI